jgi:hypothetical protein
VADEASAKELFDHLEAEDLCDDGISIGDRTEA